MSREVSNDLKALMEFVSSYNLSRLVTKERFKTLLSSQHKRYFAVLTVLAELRHQNIQPVSKLVPAHKSMNIAFHDYLHESISDLGVALFVWTHGAYKAARQLLRSSIESYFKAIGSIENEGITKLKNVYEVIEIAGDTTFFKQVENKAMFDLLKDVYGALCSDVHTATVQNMEHISALSYFPNFDERDASRFEKLFLKVSGVYVSVICLLFKNAYLKMHFKNQDIVAAALSSAIKKRVHS